MTPPSTPTPPVTPTGRTTYTGRVTAWPMVAATSLGAVVLIGFALVGDGGVVDLVVPAALLVGIVANVLTASSVRTTAGAGGVTLRWGIVGWPRARYAVDEIDRTEVVEVPWWRVSWGFWWTPTRTTCTLRSGPALRLVLRSGRQVTVTVPEPAVAAAVLAPD